MPTIWYEGKVIEILELNHNTKQFRIKVLVEDDCAFDYLPGQFITLDLPVSEKRLNRWRSYSIANSPNRDNIIELCIVKNESGIATPYLFDEVHVDSVLKFKGPDGGFVLPEDLDKEMIFICTGTGIAPFRSMIDYLVTRGENFKKIHLIFGTRYENDILYKDEFLSLSQKLPNFSYSIALSREKIEDYYDGYVHQIYKTLYKDVRSDRIFYICGWSAMVDQCVNNLIVDMNYQPSQIKYELYG